MDKYSLLESLKRNPIDLFGRRLVAVIIDYPLLFGILMLGDYALGNELYQKTIALWLVAAFAYFPIMEGFLGYTLGKGICGLRVLKTDGSRIGIKEALIRTLIRLLDANPLILVGAIIPIVMFFSTQYRQRLGDMAAGTIVLRTEDIKSSNQSSHTTPAIAPR